MIKTRRLAVALTCWGSPLLAGCCSKQDLKLRTRNIILVPDEYAERVEHVRKNIDARTREEALHVALELYEKEIAAGMPPVLQRHQEGAK
jgi:hypothetical protein